MLTLLTTGIVSGNPCRVGFAVIAHSKLEVRHELRSQDVHRVPVSGLVLQRELGEGGQDPRHVEAQGAEECLRFQVLRHPVRGR